MEKSCKIAQFGSSLKVADINNRLVTLFLQKCYKECDSVCTFMPQLHQQCYISSRQHSFTEHSCIFLFLSYLNWAKIYLKEFHSFLRSSFSLDLSVCLSVLGWYARIPQSGLQGLNPNP